MTPPKYQRRKEVISAEIINGTLAQSKKLGYSRSWKSTEDRKGRKPPHKILLDTKEGKVEIKIGDYVVFQGDDGYVSYSPREFFREWEPYQPRIETMVVDSVDTKIVNKDLDFCVLIGDPTSETPDYAIIGGPHAIENVGRFTTAMEETKP